LFQIARIAAGGCGTRLLSEDRAFTAPVGRRRWADRHVAAAPRQIMQSFKTLLLIYQTVTLPAIAVGPQFTNGPSHCRRVNLLARDGGCYSRHESQGG